MHLLRGAVPCRSACRRHAQSPLYLGGPALTPLGPQHLVFFYLLPTAFVAAVYGSLPAMLAALAATICGAYFLYDPLYSFRSPIRVELGELLWFAGLALIGAKCTADLLRPAIRLQQNRRAED